MFTYKRTPFIAIFMALGIFLGTLFIVQDPIRPFTTIQLILLYAFCYLPALGIAMLFDPAPQDAKQRFLKINFYEQKVTKL